MEEYGKCLQELKHLLFPWAYGSRNENVPEEVLQLAAISLKDIVRDWFGQVQQLNMWQALLALPLPLPPLRHIIPRIHAEWIVKKTASDTITKLIDGSCNRIIPPIA
jgi:hypothetical protein